MKLPVTFPSLGGQTIFILFVLTGMLCFSQTPGCTMLSMPADESIDVPVDTDLEWPAAIGATGYRLTIGRSPGGNDVLDDFDVGNVTTYKPDGNLPPLRQLFVTIVTYTSTGENGSCSEVSFTTTTGGLPRCTEIINPFDGDELVAYNQNITWIRDFNATGYLMSIRVKDPDGAFLLNRVDVGNGTNYKPPDFEPRTRYFVTIIPYNDEGTAEGCTAITFTTGDGPPLPDCPVLTTPTNNATGVSTNTRVAWEASDNVDGYRISMGTDPGRGDILDAMDVSSATFVELREELPKGIRIYVQINAYIGELESESCVIYSFVVENLSSAALKELVPAFFTPNSDGINDTWAINEVEEITLQKVSIFNRYGMLLKQMDAKQAWDGTLNGRNLPSDSYWYELDLLNAPNVKGYFLLKR